MPSYFLDPTSDTKAGWVEVPPGTAWSALDDAVRQPTVPDLTDYMEQSAEGAIALIRATSALVIPEPEEIVDVIGWAYATFPSANHSFEFQISVNSSQSGPIESVTADGWASARLGRGFLRSQFSYVEFTTTLHESAAEAGTTKIYAMYVELVTANPYTPHPQVGPGP